MGLTRRGALHPLMAAVYGLLNVATLTNQASGGVWHGQAPQGTARPYVILQSPRGIRWDSMTVPGEEARFEVRVVGAQPDYGDALEILGIAMSLLDQQRPVVTNHVCCALNWENTECYPDPELVNDVPVFQAVGTFRAYVEQAA